MKIRKFKKEMLESKRFKLKDINQYPVEVRVDYVHFLYRRIVRGEGRISDFITLLGEVIEPQERAR